MAFAVIVGLWLCLLGRHFFVLSHLAYGFLFGATLGCLAAEVVGSASFAFKLFVVVSLGAVGGALWLSQWLLLGWPRLSLVLPAMMTGAIPAGALLFSTALNTLTFTDNGAFWSVTFGKVAHYVCYTIRAAYNGIEYCPTVLIIWVWDFREIFTKVRMLADATLKNLENRGIGKKTRQPCGKFKNAKKTRKGGLSNNNNFFAPIIRSVDCILGVRT